MIQDGQSRALVQRLAFPLTVGLLLVAQPAWSGWQQFSSPADGLASNNVNAVTQARDGELWIATAFGANRYDGARWQTLRDSLPSPVVNAVVRDLTGRIWFGTAAGLARFDGRVWWRPDLTDPQQPGAREVQSILEDRLHDIWIGTAAGLFRYTPASDRWQRVPDGFLADPNASELFEDSRQQLWVGGPEGSAYATPARDTWTRVIRDPSAPDSVFAVGEDRAGDIWFGTQHGAWRLDASGWSNVRTPAGLPSDTVFAIIRDHAGLMWFGTADGVARFDGSCFRPETEFAPGKPIGFTRSLLADESGNVWAGTDLNGLLRFDGAAVRNHFSSVPGPCVAQPSPSIPFDQPLASNCTGPMLQDHTGALWFASRDSGATRLASDGITWSTWRTAGQVEIPNRITALLEDSDHNLWFGSRFKGLAKVDSTLTNWTTYGTATPSPLPSDSIATFFLDSAGSVWAGTANGAAQWSGSLWSPVLDQGLQGTPVRVLGFAEDGGHTLWMRTSAGLWSLDAARVQLTSHGTSEGLPDDIVSALAVSPTGELWVGSASAVSRWTGSGWESHGVAELGDTQVRTLYFDREGRLWVALRDQVARREPSGAWTQVPRSEFVFTAVQQFLEDRAGQVWLASGDGLVNWNGEQWRRLLRADGLATDAVQRLLEDSQGRIWMSADGGLTRWEPDHTAPQTVILSDQARVVPLRNASLTYGAGFGEAGDLEFQSWWDSESPSAWTTSTTSARTGLDDGVHVFHVRSRDIWHNTDAVEDTVSFVVDATAPAAVISAPLFGRPVKDRVAIVGSTADARYVRHRVEVRPLGATLWSTLDTSSVAVVQDTLAVWDTRGLGDGTYEVRLSVDDNLGLEGSQLIQVVVDNVAPFFDVTSPALIHAAQGGDVFTTGSEVHAYFPPLGFDHDATVMIDVDPSGTVPVTLPDGATLKGHAWRIGWGSAQLMHDGVLDMAVPAGVTQPLAIYAEGTGGAWQRLGGSAATTDAPLSVPLRTAGRYALFAGGTAPATGGLSGISLVPRAFSPRGSFGSRDVAIGFSLGRAGSVSVKVYNRAGRLLRVVADGLGMPAGAGVVRWDGRDRDGNMADEGLYLVTVEALGDRSTQTLAVVK